MALVSLEEKFKGKAFRMCRSCGNARGLIRKYDLRLCRRCFREIGPSIGFKKYGE
ncbi:MAG: 30S ribosomal protein S14 [Candidatus Micrarchaeota archaeon]